MKTLRDRAPSLNAETKTDVRLGSNRVNVSVDMLAAWGGKLRFQAHDPNNATAADLASDGKRYCMTDVHANCAECGVATPETVARLVHIPLEPDQVVAVLLGTAPLIDGTATTEWDAAEGHEVVTIKADGQSERLILDGADKRWDLLEAQLQDGGKTVWSIKHKDFHPVTSKAGRTVRLPGASLFEQGGDTVRILWRNQSVGDDLGDAKFQLQVPSGLPNCKP